MATSQSCDRTSLLPLYRLGEVGSGMVVLRCTRKLRDRLGTPMARASRRYLSLSVQ